MTSPLRRKRPITAPNSQPKRADDDAGGRLLPAALRGFLFAWFLTGAVVAAGSEPLLLPPSNNAQSMWKPREAAGPLSGSTRSASSVTQAANWQTSGGNSSANSDGLKWKPHWPAPSAARRVSTAHVMEPGSTTRQAVATESQGRIQGSSVRQAAQLQQLDPLDDPFGDRISQAQPAPLQLDPPGAAAGDDPPRSPMLTPAGDDPVPMPAQPMPDFPPMRPLTQQAEKETESLPSPFGQDYCEDAKSCMVPTLTLSQLGRDFTDITPHLEHNRVDLTDAQRIEYLGATMPRSWSDRDNQPVAQGRMVDFKQGRIIIEPTGGGARVQVPYDELSNEDMCFVTSWWRLPQECTLGNEKFAGRNWMAMTMTWKASALCHKPLYFEEESLERYGHMSGPFTQPVLSGAHFFLNVAVLPYKMGINPPNECRYALGYYRPGSCAPWIVDPIPLSLRGALYQTTAVAAGIVGLP